VRIGIYNMMGQEVVRLVDEVKKAGYYEVVWDGRELKTSLRVGTSGRL